MAGEFIWYELITPDPDGAKIFYDRVIGWSVDDHSAVPAGADYRMIKRSDGGNAGGVLKLDQAMREHGARPMWLGYVHVDDVDQAVADVTARGGTTLMRAFDAPDVGRIALIADAQGNPLYLMKPRPPASDPEAKSDVFSVDAVQRVGWNELSTDDVDAGRAFYREMFGWDTDQFMDMGEYGKYYFVFKDGVRIGAMSGTMPESGQTWRYYIRVPSIAAAVEAIKAGGGTVTMGPMEVPGGDHIVHGSDPQGATFALVGAA